MAEPAPLFAALVPAPVGGTAEWLTGEGGVRLRAALFPVAHALGSVVLSPGRTETIEKYYEAVDELRGRGFCVLVHDWRGQGLSQRLLPDPRRGHARGWKPFVADYGRLLDAFEARLPKPWIAIGHSMGGALTALALTEGETRFSATILTSPMLGLQLGGRPLKLLGLVAAGLVRLGRAAAYVRPAGEAKAAAFDSNLLTHDRARWDRAEALLAAQPELGLGEVTWGWLDFALSAGARLATNPAVERLAIPVSVIVAGEEALVDNAAARAFAARLPHGHLVEARGARHEILMETDALRAPFWAEFGRLAAEIAP